MKKALTVNNIVNQKVTLIEFNKTHPQLYQAFGNPQNKGIWFVWGGSGSGKSSLLLDLAKAFSENYKTIQLYTQNYKKIKNSIMNILLKKRINKRAF